MAKTASIQWGSSEDSITATYTGSGNGSVILSSRPNEGLDREQMIIVSDGITSAPITVKQPGLRERFCVKEGRFILSDGGTFNVLKNEL